MDLENPKIPELINDAFTECNFRIFGDTVLYSMRQLEYTWPKKRKKMLQLLPVDIFNRCLCTYVRWDLWIQMSIGMSVQETLCLCLLLSPLLGTLYTSCTFLWEVKNISSTPLKYHMDTSWRDIFYIAVGLTFNDQRAPLDFSHRWIQPPSVHVHTTLSV